MLIIDRAILALFLNLPMQETFANQENGQGFLAIFLVSKGFLHALQMAKVSWPFSWLAKFSCMPCGKGG